MKKNLILLLTALAITAALCLPAVSAGNPATDVTQTKPIQTIKLQTPSGPVLGALNDGIAVYKGIPYAQPPLRFAPPEKVKPWTEIRDCTRFGAIAPQTGGPVGNLKGMKQSEDCLTLNIWVKEKAANANKKLPVYVWIHGGAYANGSGAEPTYEGTAFAKEDIVVVTINYRVNALGFLATQETYNQYGTTGNWGTLDQIEALKWVKDNITAFGGDPDRVTIGGESAGAYSVSALILSPLAKGLFNNAIMESGSALAIPANSQYARANLERTIETSQQLMSTFGIKDDAAGLAKLRTVDKDVLVRMTSIVSDFTKLTAYVQMPVFDGYCLPKKPLEALKNGNVNNVNLLWGFNADEGSMFIPDTADKAQYKMVAAKIFGYDKSLEVLEKYPVNETNPAYRRTRQAFAHGMFSTVMKPFGDSMHNSGKNVYAYYYSYATPELKKANMGAAHASEIAYAFGNLPANATDEQKTLSKEMFSRWAAFIKTGNPNTASSPSGVEWEKYNPQSQRMIVFDQKVKSAKNPVFDDMAFMENILFGNNSSYLD